MPSKYAFSPKFVQASSMRPLYNVGCLFDIHTGKYFKGQRGENILNGGVAAIEGVVGIGNSFKSTIMHYRLLTVLHRYIVASGFAYDTENSMSLNRLQDLARSIDPTGELSASLDEDFGRFTLTSAVEYDGTQWFHDLRNFANERIKGDKKLQTPFVDKTGKPVECYAPIVGEVDSLSMFKSAAVLKKIDKGDIGESELNTMYMQAAAAKAQLVDELPLLTGKAGYVIMMSAHMDDIIVMDQYKGPQKKLAFVNAERKIKKVPSNFNFLTNNLFEIKAAKPLRNKTSDEVEFPANENDDMKGSTDLMEVTILPIRTKYGPTGLPFKVLISQSRGVLPTLTEFWYCKEDERFGIGGNLIHMFLELYPDVKFTRNTIRKLIDKDPKFCRAMQITADLCQMRNLWPDVARDKLTFTPAQLYAKIRELGYDWDELLETRSYWTFDQYTNPKKYLSTMDLVEMYHGTYKPYWKV